jgi:hypothetical protein
MARQTLFAYVDGYDLKDVAAELECQFAALVASRTWRSPDVWVVNQRDSAAPSDAGDLPQWDLGLNMDLPDPGTETPGWFADIEAIALFLARLHATTGRAFVIGIQDNEADFNEDLLTIDSPTPDLARLRALIGVGPVV